MDNIVGIEIEWINIPCKNAPYLEFWQFLLREFDHQTAAVIQNWYLYQFFECNLRSRNY